jgi:hypothetical protein
MVQKLLFVFLFVTFFMGVVSAEETPIKTPLDIKVDIYPKEVFPGDIVFLKITLKNIGTKNISLMKHQGNEFIVSLENAKYGTFRKTKQGTYFKLDGTRFMTTFFLEPDNEFVYYEAILVPCPDLLNESNHLFWNDLKSGKIVFNLTLSAWGHDFVYEPKRDIALITIIPRPQKEMSALFTWWASNNIDRNVSLDSFNEPRWYIYTASPELTFRFPVSKSSGNSFDNILNLEQVLSGGSLKHLLRIFCELPEVPKPLEIPRKFVDDVSLVYASPSKDFFAWFDSLHELERGFWSTEIARTYFLCALPSPWATERTAWQETYDSSSTLRSYKRDKDYLNAVLADWIPRLQHPSVSSGLLIDELRAFEIGDDWFKLRNDIDFSKPLYPYRQVAYRKSGTDRTIHTVKILEIKKNTVTMLSRYGEKIEVSLENLDDTTRAYLKLMYPSP